MNIDTLMDECNTLELRLATAQRDLERARRVIAQLADTLIEYAAPHANPANYPAFRERLDACSAAAAPFLNDTARRVLVGTLDNWNGNELLIEVLPTGEFHLAEREGPWMSWNVGQWGWLK